MKYRVEFSEPSDPEKISELSFEQDGKTYKQGDAFTPPENWRLNMDGFQGHGVRFEQPYEIIGDDGKANRDNWRNIVLPLASFEATPRKPKGD